jgi:hypothetical protein
MSYMNRALTFAQVSRRCEIQGESRLALSRIHTDPAIQQYCSVSGARERWEAARARLVPQIARVRTLERQLEGVGSEPQAAGLREELRDLYEFTFEAYRLKGMVRAMGDDTSAAPKGSASEQSITLR